MRPFHFLAFLLPMVVAQDYGSGGSSGGTTSSPAAPATTSTPPGTHVVQVGPNGDFKFDPDTITAATGDKIQFIFHPLNHSVAQSSFDKPCVPLSGSSIFSGFMPLDSGTAPNAFTITINNTQPIWLYCAQTILSHCQTGMAMVINPPSQGPNTLSAYQAAAAKTSQSEAPASVAGGVFGPISESSPSGSASPSPSGSPTGNGAWAPAATNVVAFAVAGVPAALAMAFL